MPQRSPIIFWLLLAATISVDAVAAGWFAMGEGTESTTLFFGLVFGQLTVICAWSVLLPTTIGLRWLTPFAAGALVTIVIIFTSISRLSREGFEMHVAITTIMWIHAALVATVCWLMKPTRLAAGFHALSIQQRWRFGIKHLLVLMTFIPILIVMITRSVALKVDVESIASVLVGNVLLAFSTISITQTKGFWLLRLAACMGVALLLALGSEWLRLACARDFYMYVFNLIQVIVIWSWIEVIRPQRVVIAENADRSQSLEVT